MPSSEERFQKLEMDFKEYYEELPEDEKKKRLGENKYNAVRSGEYAIAEYEAPLPEQRLSLEELRTRDKNLFLRSVKTTA